MEARMRGQPHVEMKAPTSEEPSRVQVLSPAQKLKEEASNLGKGKSRKEGDLWMLGQLLRNQNIYSTKPGSSGDGS